MESSGDHPDLPSQITCFEILPRLPSKSLMRFKCVCKSWSSLTHNPSFVTAHHNSSGCNKNTHLLLTAWDKRKRLQHFFSSQINQHGTLTPAAHLLTLPTPRTKNQRLYNAQSVNGLVFLYLYNTSVPNQTDPSHPVCIINPCTRESITLPHPSSASRIAHVTHHLWFSHVTNEYKVLQVQKLIPAVRGSGMHYVFKVFTLGTSSWRGIEVNLNDNKLSFDPHNFPFHRTSVCINGAIHWMHGTQNVIVVFDIGDEKFRVIPLPEDYNSSMINFNYSFGNLVEVGGCLALVGDRHLLINENVMRLWVLRDYQNHVWVKEIITFPLLWRGSGYPVPFCTIHTGEILLHFSSLFRQDSPHVRVLLYNMKSASFKPSDEIVLPAEWRFLNDSHPLKLLTSYEDSIVPLR